MIENLPVYVYITFIATVVLTYYLIMKASSFRKSFMIAMGIWIAVQLILSFTGFYLKFRAAPPRFPILILPPMAFLIFNLITNKGRQLLQKFNIKLLTLIHVIRIPIEIVLYWLFLHKTIPVIMTFEGRNFDILSGISAPIIYYLAFIKKIIGRNTLILWNVLCMLLLINIVITSILSSPTPFQQFAFDQPNVGILHFPFVLLPSFVVPMVLLSHVSAITQLLKKSTI